MEGGIVQNADLPSSSPLPARLLKKTWMPGETPGKA
jgi:hypothetical protein